MREFGDGGFVVVEAGRPVDMSHAVEVRRIGGGRFDAARARIDAIGEQRNAGIADSGIKRISVGRDGVQHGLGNGCDGVKPWT
jgi:hypothetical protein